MDEAAGRIDTGKRAADGSVKIGALYVIRNKLDGMEYVGSTVNAIGRFRLHRYWLRRGMHENGPLQRAWKRDGAQAFKFMVLAILEEHELRPTEQRALDTWKPSGRLYNIAHDAVSPLQGAKFTDEHRLKLSLAHKGKPLAPEMVAARVGRKRSPESIARQSTALKAKYAGGWRRAQ
jgi:group I intron endonuclease